MAGMHRGVSGMMSTNDMTDHNASEEEEMRSKPSLNGESSRNNTQFMVDYDQDTCKPMRTDAIEQTNFGLESKEQSTAFGEIYEIWQLPFLNNTS